VQTEEEEESDLDSDFGSLLDGGSDAMEDVTDKMDLVLDEVKNVAVVSPTSTSCYHA
jgi:hypothetical protein